MCGIIGYTGPRPAAPILLDSLRRLEYRGYDSAGIAIIDADGDVATVKNTNKVVDLARQVEAEGTPSGSVGIGHTRWATHGRPSVENAHPHQDCTGRIHVIHNGIVENYRELRGVTSSSARPTPRWCRISSKTRFAVTSRARSGVRSTACRERVRWWSSQPISPIALSVRE
jgi:glutamine phosphoribosylpyrophosphate amidotransferase